MKKLLLLALIAVSTSCSVVFPNMNKAKSIKKEFNYSMTVEECSLVKSIEKIDAYTQKISLSTGVHFYDFKNIEYAINDTVCYELEIKSFYSKEGKVKN